MRPQAACRIREAVAAYDPQPLSCDLVGPHLLQQLLGLPAGEVVAHRLQHAAARKAKKGAFEQLRLKRKGGHRWVAGAS